MRRRFTRLERHALFLASNGRCEICGRPLERGWHGDHIVPFSRGGETDVLNGQALCQECNLRKGAKMVDLREWQREQHEKFLQSANQWFMVVATPGAGKTTAMLNNAAAMKNTRQAHAILVVTPSVSLKEQWKSSAKRNFGFNFLENFDGYFNDSEFDGVIVTYQQIAMSPQVVRSLFRHRRVVVILDEPHHMGEKNEWGKMAEYALQHMWRGVMGSGTPFRTDKYPIPFVKYDANGRLLIDHRYSYAEGLVDEVVRAIFFRKIDIDARWMSYDDEIVTASFSDQLTERKASERLNLTLMPDSEWMLTVIQQAVADIRHIRTHEQTDAGLLIITKDTYHATQIAQVYRTVANLEPTVVSSADDHEGVEAIDRFRESDTECIISVDMVSEGVDIPRLRSLVYATNKATQLFFEQAVGRIVRVQRGYELANGLCYIPSDPRLLAFADQIKHERDYVIEIMERREYQDFSGTNTMKPPRQDRFPEILHLQAVPDGGLYLDDDFSEAELEIAREWLTQKRYRIPLEEAARIIRHELIQQKAVEQKQESYDPEKHRTDLKRACNKKAYRVSAKLGISPKSVHSRWVTEMGGSWQHHASIEELERKLAWLTSL